MSMALRPFHFSIKIPVKVIMKISFPSRAVATKVPSEEFTQAYDVRPFKGNVEPKVTRNRGLGM